MIVVVGCATAAEVDLTKLPPPATRLVSFEMDIRPIFEASCIRCHGSERPKSRFSLVTRQAALRGGESGVAIIPGDSSKSPLIHYVAGLVPGMEMPPVGKGTSLTGEQIAILRAWIDAGASWDGVSQAAQAAGEFSFTPALRWATVSGNAQRFQQHQWIRRGFAGGAADFRVAQKTTNGVAVLLEGSAMTDDYRVTLEVRKEELGFARFGFEEFRRYYDYRGPYYPFRPSGFASRVLQQYDVDRDLHMDVGKAFAEFGLTVPDRPQITIGYDYQYKEGSKSTEQWGPVTQQSGGTNVVRNIFPALKEVREEVHVLRADVAHEVAGVALADNLRIEFTDLKTRRVNGSTFSAGEVYPDTLTVTRETHDQFQLANSIHGGKALEEWLYLSAGYLYSRLDADARLRQSTVDGAGRPAAGTFWMAPEVTLEEDAHVVNLAGQAGPFDGLTAAAGLQAGLSESTGFGDTDLREGDPNDPTFPVSEPALVRSDMDRLAFQESVSLRYSRFSAVTFFADARMKQEQVAQFEEQNGGNHDFLRDSDVDEQWQEYKAGFDISPWQFVSLHAAYRKRHYDTDYDHDRDEQPHGTAGEGYSAFITSRETDTDLVEGRLVVRPVSWFKASVAYQWTGTDFRTAAESVTTPTFDTPGGTILAGQHDSGTYSANVTVTPWQRWVFSSTVSYQESRIETAENGAAAVAPYRGHVSSMLLGATFIVDKATDVNGSYTFSRARYSQANVLGGLPLGIDYDLHGVQGGLRRRFSSNISASLQYGYFNYREPSARGFNDYTAHVLFGMLAVSLP
jgi:hypothetical protein